MKATVSTDKFSQAIFRADKVAGKNLSLQVLGGILLQVKGPYINVKATNLDLGISVPVSAKTVSEGSVVVPSVALNSFLTNLVDRTNIDIGLSGSVLVIKTKTNRATFKTYATDDFPKLPTPPNKNTLTLDSEWLAKGLKSVWYSASPSSMKPELSSIFISNDDGSLVFAATDSFRLSEKRISVKEKLSFQPLLIPLKNTAEIIRNLEVAGGPVKMFFDENQLAMEFSDGTQLTTRVIDGTFPDYEQILPKTFESEVTLLKQDLVSAMKVTNVFSNKFNQTTLKIHPRKKLFAVETHNPEVGDSVATVDAAISGESIDIGFNHKYITDAIPSLDGDSIILQLAGKGKPMVIKPVGDRSFTYLVMPMNR